MAGVDVSETLAIDVDYVDLAQDEGIGWCSGGCLRRCL